MPFWRKKEKKEAAKLPHGVVTAGYLYILSVGHLEFATHRNSWKRRYFALWNSTILYYFTKKEESDRFFSGGDGAAAASTSTTGFIDLSDAKSIVQLGGREGVIEIKTPSRTWYLRPETEVTTRKWSKGEIIVF